MMKVYIRSFVLIILLFVQRDMVAQNTIAAYDLQQEKELFEKDAHRYPLYSSVKPFQPGFDSILFPAKIIESKKFWKRILNDQPFILYQDEKNSFFLNPVISLTGGTASSNKIQESTLHFGRGFHGGALFNKKWQIDFSFVENQSRLPAFLDSFNRENYRILPGVGQVKVNDENNYDYSYTNGFVRWMPNSKFSATLGHGQHFLGEGYRSLFLSDNAYNYPYLQVNLNTKHVHYMVMFNQYTNLFKEYGETYQRKWSATNFLNIAVTKRFQLGLFQGVIWQDRDSSGKRGFDVQYLIPTTIVRPIEFSQGSADNTFLGIHGNYRIKPSVLGYFQFFLDDINIRETFKNDKQHINNKYSFQLGLKGLHEVSGLLMRWRAEYNYSRPYNYGHRKPEQSYTHYQQALAHPLGANFHEAIVTYDVVFGRWYGSLIAQHARIGREDRIGFNDGNNLFGGEENVPEFGTKTLQGDKQDQTCLQGTAGFIVNKAWRTGLEINFLYKNQQSKSTSRNFQTTWIQVGIVTRLRNQYLDF